MKLSGRDRADQRDSGPQKTGRSHPYQKALSSVRATIPKACHKPMPTSAVRLPVSDSTGCEAVSARATPKISPICSPQLWYRKRCHVCRPWCATFALPCRAMVGCHEAGEGAGHREVHIQTERRTGFRPMDALAAVNCTGRMPVTVRWLIQICIKSWSINAFPEIDVTTHYACICDHSCGVFHNSRNKQSHISFL